MPLSGYSVGTYPETSSQATCQERIGHSRLSSLNHCGLILTLRVELARANSHQNKTKKARAGNESSNILPKSSHARKKATTTRRVLNV